MRRRWNWRSGEKQCSDTRDVLSQPSEWPLSSRSPLQVTFLMSDETNLADLLALNLHKFEDEVKNIVDKASKELKMEHTLQEMEVTWAQMEFEHDIHPRTGTKLLRSSEELIETLEDNQVTYMHVLKNVHTCMYIKHMSVHTYSCMYICINT